MWNDGGEISPGLHTMIPISHPYRLILLFLLVAVAAIAGDACAEDSKGGGKLADGAYATAIQAASETTDVPPHAADQGGMWWLVMLAGIPVIVLIMLSAIRGTPGRKNGGSGGNLPGPPYLDIDTGPLGRFYRRKR